MANILIIDDDRLLCDMMCRYLERIGHAAEYAPNLEDGHRKLSSKDFDVVYLDVGLPDGSGLHALPNIHKVPSSPEVIIFTAEGDPSGAELAIQSGAWDYIEKPSSIEAMTLPLIRALQYREEKRPITTPLLLNREGILGESKQLRSCLTLVADAANNDSNVLITGETGTGKELFAKAIHKNSARAGENLIVIDCGAVTETLVESMLFGHEKGAFTGADKTKVGLIKLAHRGTLFFDEVGELPMSIQSTFLRVLQERRFRPVGAKKEIDSDFRLIVATNRDLDQMVQAGKFRNDLLFRLRTISIDLPPLKKRNKDIKDIAFYYMANLCDRHGLGTKGFSPEFLEALTSYDWPGNVRELVNAIESALSASQNEPTLFPYHLPQKIRIKVARLSVAKRAPKEARLGKSTESTDTFPNLRSLMEKTERQYFQDLIAFTGGNIKEVCRISGLSRTRLYERLKKYEIRRQF